jgi:Predicted membrane-bound metal-dependent hydrolases
VDTVTHALFGALASRAVATKAQSKNKFHNPYMPATIAAVAGAFPDIDYVMFWVNPLTFLAEWHRSYTHSLVLLPLWTILLTGIFILVLPAMRKQWLITTGFAALGLASHILLDLLTVYGTKIFYPVSNHAFSLGTTFVIDPILSFLVITGLIVSCYRPPRFAGVSCIFVLGVYVLIQWHLKTQACETGTSEISQASATYIDTVALPQPFSPFHWRIIIRENDGYSSALIDLLGVSEKLARWEGILPFIDLVSAYRDVANAKWEKYTLFGDQPGQQLLARAVWEQKVMGEFRKFARFPVLYRIDQGDHATTCVWFSDLRYHISTVQPPFRYGMCRGWDSPEWERYRLRYFSINDRQHF